MFSKINLSIRRGGVQDVRLRTDQQMCQITKIPNFSFVVMVLILKLVFTVAFQLLSRACVLICK